MWQPSDPPSPALATESVLQVRAGGRRLALPIGVIRQVGPCSQFVRVPGTAPWLLGLMQWRAGLISLVDAGLLFGDAPSQRQRIVVLRGLAVDVALAVDEILRPDASAQPAEIVLDLARLSHHPAFQPGAAQAAAPTAAGAA